MVCLGYFLTVSCEKNVDFFLKIDLKKIFDWSESGIRILLPTVQKTSSMCLGPWGSPSTGEGRPIDLAVDLHAKGHERSHLSAPSVDNQ